MNLRGLCLCLMLSWFVPFVPLASATAASPPKLMLATGYVAGVDVGDYWVSEKLDGVRGHWDGRRLRTRSGLSVDAPAWFTAEWPGVAMDGELWTGRGRFDEVSAIVRAAPGNDAAWRRVRFMVFDLPGDGRRFEARVGRMRTLLDKAGVAWLRPVPQLRVRDAAVLDARLQAVVAAGGEGLMLQHRNARYRAGRSDHLLKLKPFDDAEARVVGHTAGKGKYTGMLGALVVQRADGLRFRLGSGLSDAQRARPPPVGAIVTYRYNGLTAKGVPRFARFMRIRTDR